MAHVCRRVEIGRSGFIPETMVKWEGSPIPAPYMYFRTTSTVAYAEICAPGDILDTSWNDVVSCAITAGETVGISTIIADPEATRGTFELAFKSCAVTKLGEHADRIQVSLSTGQQPNTDWHR